MRVHHEKRHWINGVPESRLHESMVSRFPVVSDFYRRDRGGSGISLLGHGNIVGFFALLYFDITNDFSGQDRMTTVRGVEHGTYMIKARYSFR